MFAKDYLLTTNLSTEESSKKVSRLLKTNDNWDISIGWKKFKMERPHNYSGGIENFEFRIEPDGYRFSPLFIKGAIAQKSDQTEIQLTIKPTLPFYISAFLMILSIICMVRVFTLRHLWNVVVFIPLGIALLSGFILILAFYSEQSRSKKFLISLFEAEEMSL